jgi:hypothetical protein
MPQREKKNTTIAHDKEGNFININNDNVLSGAHDYFCVGCKAQMIAHLPQYQIKRYFRHNPKFIDIHKKLCKWSDEKTLHKLAQDILQIEKKIAVPRLLKFPPNGPTETNVYKIRDSEIIGASYVKNEMDFFEDINGKLNFKKLRPEEKSLVESHIIPDVTFFNSENKPILFIEIVVTSGIKENKWLKIKRLGIDTIQVKIPTDSIESVNEYFRKHRTNHTKWIYNNEEQNTSYFSFSPSSGKGISRLEDYEGSIFEENFKCRKNQIGGLIRRIRQILEQEHYTEIIGGVEYEILRADEDTERNIERLRRIQNDVRTRIEGKYSEQNSELTKGEGDFREYKGKVENLNKEEQIRIKREGEQLDNETKQIEDRITECQKIISEQDIDIERVRGEIREFEASIFTFNEQARGVEEELIDVSGRIQQFRNSINEIQSKETGINKEFLRRVKALPTEYIEIERRMEEDSQRRRTGIINEFERRKGAIRPDFEREEKRLEQDFEFRRTKMQREFDENSKRIIEGVRRRDSNAVPELRDRLNGCNKIHSALIDIGKVKADGRRLQIVKKCFESKSWKNWDRFRDVSEGNG